MRIVFLLLVVFTIYIPTFSQSSNIPIVSKEQRELISNPQNGLLVYESTTQQYYLYALNCNCWEQIESQNENDTLNINFGNNEGYTSFEKDGTLIFHKDATVYEDLTIPITSSKLHGSNAPTFDMVKNNGEESFGVFTYWFDYDSDEELFFTVQIPHKRKANSDLYPHIHWLPTTDLNEKKVNWGLEYTTANVNDIFKNTVIISNANALESSGTPKAYQHLITELGVIKGESIGISNMFICRIFRDADSEKDTYEEEAGLLQIDFHYEIDAIGSRKQFEK